MNLPFVPNASVSVASTWFEILVRPACNAALAAAAGSYFFGPMNMEIMGYNVSLPVLTFAAVFGGNILSEIVHMYIFPLIPGAEKWSLPVSELLNIGVTAGSFEAVLYLLDQKAPAELGVMNGLLLCAASVGLGDYIFQMFLQPMIMGYGS